MKRSVSFLLPVFFFFLLLTGCPPSDTESGIEAARFKLDGCNPSKSATVTICQEALDLLTPILASEPTNLEAAVLASSARLGLAGVDFLKFAEKLVGLRDSTTGDFQQFADLIGSVEKDRGEELNTDRLRDAVTVLSTALAGLSGDTDIKKRALFQLGATQAVETFVLPVKLTTALSTTGTGTRTYDSSKIDKVTPAVADTLKENFLKGDDNLTGGGTSDSKTLDAQRKAYCLCTHSTFGYSDFCVRDLMRCQLSGGTTPTGTEQDYDGDIKCGDGGKVGFANKAHTTNCATAGDYTEDCDALVKPTGTIKTNVDNCVKENTK